MFQLSHLYMTTEKTIALTIQAFVGKVMSLLFNTLSRFVIAFLPRSKHLLLTWLQLQSAVTLESQEIKSVTVYVCVCVLVAHLGLTISDLTDCSLPGSSLHGILHARVLEWVAISSSRDLPYPGIEPMSLRSPALASRFFII